MSEGALVTRSEKWLLSTLLRLSSEQTHYGPHRPTGFRYEHESCGL